MSGILTHSPAAVIRQLLVDLGEGTLPSADGSWPVYSYRSPDGVDSLITVTNTTPRRQGRYMPTGEVVQFYALQIAVRTTDPETGWTKVNAIATTLTESVERRTVTVSDVVGTGSQAYTVYACHIVSGPIDAGKDVPAGKRNLFALNITASISQAA